MAIDFRSFSGFERKWLREEIVVTATSVRGKLLQEYLSQYCTKVRSYTYFRDWPSGCYCQIPCTQRRTHKKAYRPIVMGVTMATSPFPVPMSMTLEIR